MSPLSIFLLNVRNAQEAANSLESEGFSVRIGRAITKPDQWYTEEELIGISRETDAIMITGSHPITRNVMESSDRLFTIAKTGAGADAIDDAAATDLGILLTNTPVFENGMAVAEGTVARILSLAVRLKEDDAKLRRGEWRDSQHFFMRGKTVGIIGLGHIGSHVARLLEPLGVKIIATNRHGARGIAELLNVQLVNLNTLLTNSDFVTIHCPATPETRKMLGLDQLLLMKRTAFLINTARGSIVDETALYNVLKDGRIAGAAIDVFEKEPLNMDSPLLDLSISDRVLLTSHTSGAIPEAREASRLTQMKNCIAA